MREFLYPGVEYNEYLIQLNNHLLAQRAKQRQIHFTIPCKHGLI